MDPGVHTGIAIYDLQEHTLLLVTTSLHRAFDLVKSLIPMVARVYIEDPNMWTRFRNPQQARARLQGAGSVKRDFSAWKDFLNDNQIPFTAVQPDKSRNKWAEDPKLFAQVTGYDLRSAHHARVAGMLVAREFKRGPLPAPIEKGSTPYWS